MAIFIFKKLLPTVILILHISWCFTMESVPKFHERIVLKRTDEVRFEDAPGIFSLHGQVGLRIHFRAFRRNFLILAACLASRPPPIISPSVRINLISANRTIRSLRYDHVRYYVGRLVDVPGSYFSGYVSDEEFLSEAVIETTDETYHLEPAKKYFENADKLEIIVYPTSHVLLQHCSQFSRNFSRPCFAEAVQGKAGPIPKNRSKRHLDQATMGGHLSPYTYLGGRHFKNRLCGIHAVADHTFYRQSVYNEKTVIHQLIMYVDSVSKIFKSTDFTNDGDPDGIQLQIQQITMFSDNETEDDPQYNFRDEDLDAGSLLEKFSQFIGAQTIQHCLAIAFTARDFRPTLDLGKAYIANSNFYGPSGGICDIGSAYEKVPRNTVVMTTLSGGEMQPASLTVSLLAHLIGHSFGAPNDDETCFEPGDNSYLMYPFTNLPNRPNNLKFSRCSIDRILPILRNKGWCLELTTEYGFCGDLIIQNQEECDCGMTDEECQFVDPCCASADQGNRSCKIRRDKGFTCSPFNSRCCNSRTCRPLTRKQFCAPPEQQCVQYGTCNSKDHVCPKIGNMKDGMPCGGGAAACLNGFCNSTVCAQAKLEDCQCTFPAMDRCKVCCRQSNDSGCYPAEQFVSSGGYLLPGSSCMNNTGYCTFDDTCRILRKGQTAKEDMMAGPKVSPSSRVGMWIFNYWFIIFLGIVLLIFLILVVRGLVQMYQMSRAILPYNQAIQVGLRRVWMHPRHPMYPNVVQVCASRLLALFPGVPVDEAFEVASTSDSEDTMIRLLLGRGYPCRTAYFTRENFSEFERAPPRI